MDETKGEPPPVAPKSAVEGVIHFARGRALKVVLDSSRPMNRKQRRALGRPMGGARLQSVTRDEA